VSTTKLVAVGTGSRLRGDDAAGPLTADLLADRLGSGERPTGLELEVIDADVMPESYTRPLRESGADAVVFIDAVDMGLRPGELRIVPKELIDSKLPCSHSLPMSYVMGYVNEKVPVVELVGVQAASTGLFLDAGDEVLKACQALCDIIWKGEVLSLPRLPLDAPEDRSAESHCW